MAAADCSAFCATDPLCFAYAHGTPAGPARAPYRRHAVGIENTDSCPDGYAVAGLPPMRLLQRDSSRVFIHVGDVARLPVHGQRAEVRARARAHTHTPTHHHHHHHPSYAMPRQFTGCIFYWLPAVCLHMPGSYTPITSEADCQAAAAMAGLPQGRGLPRAPGGPYRRRHRTARQATRKVAFPAPAARSIPVKRTQRLGTTLTRTQKVRHRAACPPCARTWPRWPPTRPSLCPSGQD